MANIGSLVVSLQARTESLEKQLARANGLIRRLQKETRGIGDSAERAERRTVRSFARIGVGAGGLRTRIVAVSSAFRTLAVAGAAFLAGSFIVRTVEATDQLGKFADRIQITVEGLQELEFAASQSGVTLQTFQLGFQRILRRAEDAVAGNDQLAQAFDRLGLSVERLQELISTRGGREELFVTAITNAARLRDGLLAIQRIADSEGVALRQLGLQGAEGIARLRDEARRLGLILDESLVRKAAEANDQLDRIRRIVSANLSRAILQITPQIDSFGRSLGRIVERISNVNMAIDGLTDRERVIADFFRGVVQAGQLALQVLTPIADLIGDIAARITNILRGEPFARLAPRGITGLNPNLDPLTGQGGRQRAIVNINTSRTRREEREQLQRVQRIQQELDRLQDRAQRSAESRLDAFLTRLRQRNEAITESVVDFRTILSNAFDAIGQAVAQSAIGVARGTQTIEDALRNLGNSISAFLINQGVQSLLGLAQGALFPAVPTPVPGAANTGIAPSPGGSILETLAPGENRGVTIINAPDMSRAEELARQEEALGRRFVLNVIDSDIAAGNASPRVRGLRSVLGR